MPTGAKGVPGPLQQEVAAILREKIGRLQANQNLIAADAGISPAQLSGILKGRKHVDVEQLDNICRSIGLRMWEIVREAEEASTVRLLEDQFVSDATSED